MFLNLALYSTKYIIIIFNFTKTNIISISIFIIMYGFNLYISILFIRLTNLQNLYSKFLFYSFLILILNVLDYGIFKLSTKFSNQKMFRNSNRTSTDSLSIFQYIYCTSDISFHLTFTNIPLSK